MKKKDLNERFDRQMERLIETSYYLLCRDSDSRQHFTQDLLALRRRLPREITVKDGNLAILLVIPHAYIDVTFQIRHIIFKGMGAYTFLPLKDRWESQAPSPKPYAILDVEPGAETMYHSATRSNELHRVTKRISFGLEEGISLLIHHPGVLERRNIHMPRAVMSGRNDEPDTVLDFWVYANSVKLKRDVSTAADHRWGSPSYRRAITL